jgi:putative ABC transport system permease protein
VEIWGRYGTRLKLANGTDRYIGLRALPLDSQIFNPTIVAGRGLLPGDDRAILLNHRIAVDEGIQVGERVRFDIRERETEWTVVGLILFPEQYESFVPYHSLAREAGIPRRGTRVHVVTERHDLAYQRKVVESLRAAYALHNMETTWAWSTGEMWEQQWQQYSTIHYLLLAMALLAALVGGIGLMGVVSINVVERRREIGVMRATGATSLAIVGIFVAEGVLLGALSWVIASPFSLPAARFASRMIGQELLQYPLVFAYSFGGMALWLGIAVALASLASLWPALQASRVSVREALAYE